MYKKVCVPVTCTCTCIIMYIEYLYNYVSVYFEMWSLKMYMFVNVVCSLKK